MHNALSRRTKYHWKVKKPFLSFSFPSLPARGLRSFPSSPFGLLACLQLSWIACFPPILGKACRGGRKINTNRQLAVRELRVWNNRQIPCSILKPPLSNEAKGRPFLVILNLIYLRIIKIIYMSVMTSPVASLWNRGLGRLGKGLFLISIDISLYKLLKTLFHSRTLRYLHLHVISLYFSHSVNPIRVSISYSTPCGLKCYNRLSCFNWWRHVVSQCSQRFVLVKTNAICCC